MPYIRGLRDYKYYNDEDIDHQLSFEEIQAIRLSQVPPFKPSETLSQIAEALRNLPKGTISDEDPTPSLVDVKESGGGDGYEEPQQFFTENAILPPDIKVAVEGVGEIDFPVEEDLVVKLVGISTEVKINRNSEEEVEDNRSQDFCMIPGSEVKVDFKEESLKLIEKSIQNALNISKHCSLELSISNISVYGPGQFFNMHKGSEEDEKYLVRLVLVLPSQHDGGDLYIKRGLHTHKFCSSEPSEKIRFIAFYSDCERQVFEVEKGYRIVLIYDVEVHYPGNPESWVSSVNVALNTAVAEHFSLGISKLLVFLLHRYTRDNLTWHRLKGRDLTYAQALQAVAKSQGLAPYLVLGKCLETWEASGYHGPVRNGCSIDLLLWVDEDNTRVDMNEKVDYEQVANEVCVFRGDFWSLGEPDTEVKLGWYGEGPAIREQWYNRACVVLLKT